MCSSAWTSTLPVAVTPEAPAAGHHRHLIGTVTAQHLHALTARNRGIWLGSAPGPDGATTATKRATSHWTARSPGDKGPSLPVGMGVQLANLPRTSCQQTPPGPGFRSTRGPNRFPRPGTAAKGGRGGGRGTMAWWAEDRAC